jgi:hypothetical protein
MRYLYILIVMLTSSATLSAQPEPADLTRKLGSGSFVERDRAAKALEQLGKTAMPALRAAVANGDLETQRRALLVIERIEDRIVLADILTPTPIRLQLGEMSVTDALLKVQSQMGLPCGAAITKKTLAKLDTGTLPYWQAWQRFCEAAGLSESDYARSAAKLRRLASAEEQQRVMLVGNRDYRMRPRFGRIEFDIMPDVQRVKMAYSADVRHSVRVRGRWLTTDRSIDAGETHAIFAFEVRPEPRLEIAAIPSVELTKIIDVQGQERPAQAASMLAAFAAPQDVPYLHAYAGEVQFGGLLHLKAIPWPDAARSIKELHGRVRMETVSRPSILEIENVLKAAGKVARGYHAITVKVLDIDATEEGDHLLRLHLSHLESLTPQNPEQGVVRVRPGLIAVRGAIDVAIERIELRDQHGLKYGLVKSAYKASEDGKGHEVELQFAGRACKDAPTLVLTKAARTVPFEVPFVLRDLTWMAESPNEKQPARRTVERAEE